MAIKYRFTVCASDDLRSQKESEFPKISEFEYTLSFDKQLRSSRLSCLISGLIGQQFD